MQFLENWGVALNIGTVCYNKNKEFTTKSTKDTKKKAKGDTKIQFPAMFFHKKWSPVNQLRNLRDLRVLRGKAFLCLVINLCNAYN